PFDLDGALTPTARVHALGGVVTRRGVGRVVGVSRASHADALRAHGATIVAADPSQLPEAP
ncbi:MAG: hypothetical protein ACRDPA_12595, partial [Solirubrobacteraceae bacterium]